MYDYIMCFVFNIMLTYVDAADQKVVIVSDCHYYFYSVDTVS